MGVSVITRPELCLGCKICMLVCSWQQDHEFQPGKSAIKVEVDEKNLSCSVEVLEDQCTGCMLCVKNCPADALEKSGEETNPS